jgi:hypothetical protein
MRNGYALCTRVGLEAIAEHLRTLKPEQVGILRGKLRIGIQSDVEVTDAEVEQRPLVSQAFCSALPVAYTNLPSSHWKPFASLVLEAAYEATMLAAVLNKLRGRRATFMGRHPQTFTLGDMCHFTTRTGQCASCTIRSARLPIKRS